MEDEDFGEAMWQSLERQEAAVKEAITSVGEVEGELKAAVEALNEVEAADGTVETGDLRAAIGDVGRALEIHEDRLETVIRRLNEHKGVVRRADDVGDEQLARAMAEARRQARQEADPSGGDRRGGPDAGADR